MVRGVDPPSKKRPLDLEEAYAHIRRRVDAFFSRVRAAHGAEVQCAPRCTPCCQVHLTVSPIEAGYVHAAVRALPERLREEVEARARARSSLPMLDRSGGPCPLLIDERCTIYSARPLLCRAQGLPMLVRGDGPHPEYTVCQLNFEAGPPGGDAILNLDHLNRQLAAVNILWCRSRGLDPTARIPLARAILGGPASGPDPTLQD